MGNLASYSALTTKVRAMTNKFITQDQYRTLLSYSNAEAALDYLKTTKGYEEALRDLPSSEHHRVNLFHYLSRASYNDYASIYHFSNQDQRKFLKQYGRRFETIMIKRRMNTIFNGGEPEASQLINKDFFDHYTDLDVDALFHASSIDGVLSILKDTPYNKVLSAVAKNPDASLFEYETALDQFYFASIWRNKGLMKDKRSEVIIKEAFGSRFDLLNIMWINRIHRYYKMNRAEIYATLVPIYYHLTEEEVEAMVNAPDEESFRNILKDTYYGRSNKLDLSEDASTIDYTGMVRNILDILARQTPYSIATPYRYLYTKEHEISKLLTALECVHYQLPVNEAMTIINKM